MNIKRAFLTAVAVLMLPAMAWAQETITFDTDLNFSNDASGTVTATLICNTGVPLEQDFEISEDAGVVFVVNEVAIDAATQCEITVTGVFGYATTAVANGDPTGDSCVYTGDEPGPGEAGLDNSNSCSFLLVPAGFVYTINKEWEANGDLDFLELADLEYELEGTCFNVRPEADSEESLSEASFDCLRFGTDDASCSSPTWYADPDGGTYCTGTEKIDDSSVESVNGCAAATGFVVGKTQGSCTIVNTVFFEGVPTLSQYGLAIMALLMLGVGYVGFRRFV